MDASTARKPAPSWGPGTALLGVLLALVAGTVLAIPALLAAHPRNGELGPTANAVAQLATALGFVVVPLLVALRWGGTLGDAARRLGVRPFRPSAFGWMAAAVVAYLVFAVAYAALIGEPKQQDVAKGFGPLWVQAALIVFAAPVSEEICFRGMLFGGLRTRLPLLAAALVSGLVFGVLHALTGVSAVPPLTFFGFLLALLYERTGSILPGILLHMLNNSVALLAR